METIQITENELKMFMKAIASKFNLKYKDVAKVWNDMCDEEDSSNVAESSEPQPQEVQVLESSNTEVTKVESSNTVNESKCQAIVKKTGVQCTKPQKVGKYCSIHKNYDNSVSSTKEIESLNTVVQSSIMDPFKCEAIVKKTGVQCTKPQKVGKYCAIHKNYESKASTSETTEHDKPVAESIPDKMIAKITCQAKLKNGKLCGKKQSVGSQYCTTHKKKYDAEDIKGETKGVIPENSFFGTELAQKVITKLNYEMHPRLGLWWDRKARLVFYKENDETYTCIAKFINTVYVLEQTDIDTCNNNNIPYRATNYNEIHPQYPDQITIDGEYDRIRYDHPEAFDIKDVVQDKSDKQDLVITKDNNESIVVIETVNKENEEPQQTNNVVESNESTEVIRTDVKEPEVENKPCKKPCKTKKVKNIVNTDKLFPKKRGKDKKQEEDIVSVLNEITEPVLCESQL